MRWLPAIRRAHAGALLTVVVSATSLGACGEGGDGETRAPETPVSDRARGSAVEHPRPEERSQRSRAFVALEEDSAVAVLRGPPWRVARRVGVPIGPHNVAPGGG